MSLTTDTDAIKVIVEGKLLKRVPKGLKIEKAPSTFNHNSYQLTFDGLYNPEAHISNDYIWSHSFTLEVKYVANTDDERVEIQENLITLIKALVADASFHGIIGNTIPFVPIDDNHYKGTLKFLFGLGISA